MSALRPADIGAELAAMIQGTAKDLGITLKMDGVTFAQHTAARVAHLGTIVGKPGFEDALKAERDSLALRAGVLAVRAADVVDSRIVGLIQAALSIGARALASA